MPASHVSGPYVTGSVCVVCGARYRPGETAYVCPKHGNEGLLDVEYDYEAARAVFNAETLAASPERGMWRYRDMLPLPADKDFAQGLQGLRQALENIRTPEAPGDTA